MKYMANKKSLAQKIKTFRKSFKISQQEVADKINVSRATYSDMERANREVSAYEIKLLADLFEISVDELLAEDDFKETILSPTEEVIFVEDKLRNTLLYILETCGGKPNLGETVLYKLLYFIDFDQYDKYGKSVTGLSYVHQQFGPVPLQTQYRNVVDNMKDEQELKIFFQEYYGKKQKRYVALRNHTLGILSEEEKGTIISVINRLSDMSATEIADYAHLDIPWKITNNKEVISYNLVFDREPPFSRRNHMQDIANAAADDILKDLGEMDEQEYDYYKNL